MMHIYLVSYLCYMAQKCYFIYVLKNFSSFFFLILYMTTGTLNFCHCFTTSSGP